VTDNTTKAGRAVVSGGKRGLNAIVSAGKTAGEAVCDGTTRTVTLVGSAGANAVEKTLSAADTVSGAGKKLVSTIAGRAATSVGGLGKKRKKLEKSHEKTDF
jgi:hypothetical protein